MQIGPTSLLLLSTMNDEFNCDIGTLSVITFGDDGVTAAGEVDVATPVLFVWGLKYKYKLDEYLTSKYDRSTPH